MSLRAGLVILLSLGAAGCASSIGQRDSSLPDRPVGVVVPSPVPDAPSQPLPQVPSPIPQPVPMQPAAPAAPPAYPRSAEQISGQAVVSLMRTSSEARAKGHYDLAVSQLERAQRIEPRNYFVWSALAKVYLDQQQYEQALSVAGKSNSLARGNVYVELENWKTIAAARRALGDSIGALQAQARIEEIGRTLGLP